MQSLFAVIPTGPSYLLRGGHPWPPRRKAGRGWLPAMTGQYGPPYFRFTFQTISRIAEQLASM